MKNSLIKTVLPIAFIAVCFVVIYFISNFADRSKPPLPSGSDDADLALQISKLKGLDFGFNGLFADWYWVQSLQYIGGKVANTEGRINLENLQSLNPRLLYPMIDNATTLDQRFITAYSYGAVVLPAINPLDAIKIGEKGIANNPGEWVLYQQLGYVYWRTKNYDKASEIYERGAQQPNAPSFMQFMAAQMKSQGGSRQTARAIYEQMFQQSQDSQTKETAALHLASLDATDELDSIRPVLIDFATKNGRCAANWREIFPVLQSLKINNKRGLTFDASTHAPLDPSNIPYLLISSSASSCNATIDPTQSKIPALGKDS